VTPLEISIHGFPNNIKVTSPQFWQVLIVSYINLIKIDGRGTLFSKLMGSQEPLKPILTEPLEDGQIE